MKLTLWLEPDVHQDLRKMAKERRVSVEQMAMGILTLVTHTEEEIERMTPRNQWRYGVRAFRDWRAERRILLETEGM